MARGKKTGGRNFEPGNKAGKGRPTTPKDVKELRLLNQYDIERVINKYLNTSTPELAALIKKQELPSLDLMVCTIIYKAAAKGDHVRAEWVMSRLVGPMKQRLEHTGKDGEPLFKSFSDLADAAAKDANDDKK